MKAVEVLTREELMALAGLLRVIVLADREVDGYELDALERVGGRVAVAGPAGDPYRAAAPEAMGPDAFRALFGEASRALPDAASVKAAAAAVERTEAREVIFALVFEVAAANGIVPEEQLVIDWLEQRWDLHPKPVG